MVLATLNSMLYTLNSRRELRAVAQKAILMQIHVPLELTKSGDSVKLAAPRRARKGESTNGSGTM